MKHFNKGISETLACILKTVYYKDGTSKDFNIEGDDYNSFIFDNLVAIDSIIVSIKNERPNKLITKIISKENKSAKFRDGTIQFIEIDKNNAKFKLDNSIYSYLLAFHGKTKSGYLVSSNQSTSSTTPQTESDKFKLSIKESLGAINKKIDENKYKTKEDFIVDIVTASEQIYQPINSNFRSVSALFKGNVEELHLPVVH